MGTATEARGLKVGQGPETKCCGKDSKCLKKIAFWVGPAWPLGVSVAEKMSLQPFCTGVITHQPLPDSRRGCHHSSWTAHPSGISRESHDVRTPTDPCTAALPSLRPQPQRPNSGLPRLGKRALANTGRALSSRSPRLASCTAELSAPQTLLPGWLSAPGCRLQMPAGQVSLLAWDPCGCCDLLSISSVQSQDPCVWPSCPALGRGPPSPAG